MAEFVVVEGVEEAVAKLTQIMGDLSGPPMARAMGDVTMKLARDAASLAPVDTGKLRDSITGEVRVLAEELQGVVGSNLHYAPYLELGTGPYEITATRAKALAFFWEHGPDGSKMYFFKRVRHPGIKARRFLQRAFEQNKEYIFSKIGNVVAEIVRK